MMSGITREVIIPAGPSRLEGLLVLPPEPVGVVAFAHGSGSSRFSTRNRFVAEVLHTERIGTLLFDLLSEAEARDRTRVFDIPLLAGRLGYATDWLAAEPATQGLPLGYFGASTGGAAALTAAALRPEAVSAVVSRGGRPDLAEAALSQVEAATLLIVGEHDPIVLRLNRRAYALLHCQKHLVVIPGASHLFEESGTLEAAARHAAAWFHTHLAAAGAQLAHSHRHP